MQKYKVWWMACMGLANPAMTVWAQSADSTLIEGRVIKLQRESEIFAQPSGRSKVLADADRDSVLILRKISPKKNWLLVEDEDRHQGWVPRQRTDFVEWTPVEHEGEAASAGAPAGEKGIDTQREGYDSERAILSQVPRWQHGLTLVGRRSYYDLNGNQAGGLMYTLLSPPQVSRVGENLRSFRTAFSTGYFRTSGSGYSIPLRFRLMAGKALSDWVSGPDFGLWWMKSVTGDQNLGLGLGYSFAWFPSASFYLGLRGGLEFRWGTRFSYELSVGYFL